MANKPQSLKRRQARKESEREHSIAMMLYGMDLIKQRQQIASTGEKLKVTAHAIERFRQRIENISEAEIKSKLSADYLLRAYEDNPHGKYPLKGYPNVIACIVNYKVKTVYRKTNQGENPEPSVATESEQRT